MKPVNNKTKIEQQVKRPDQPVPDSSDQQSDSLGSKQIQQIQQFNSDQSWAQLDQLQQHLFNGSHQQQTPDTQPKKPKKKQQQAAKMLQIQQQQKWLQKFRAEKMVGFHDPFKPQKLAMNSKKVIKSLQDSINNSIPINPVTKSMGIKPVKILNKWKINEQFQWFINYIENGEVPQCLVIQFENFMKDKEPWEVSQDD